METVTVPDGMEIAYKRTGSGPPLVLVHGAWSSHHDWDGVVPALAESFHVVAYDRRGHSQSERPPGQGSIHEDVDDLAELIERLRLDTAWVVGNSFGASIALRLVAEHAELLHGVIAHEPPLFDVISDDSDLAPLVEEDEKMTATVADRIASGDHEGGARLFIEHELGSGSWSQLPPDFRATLIENAPTFLDESRDSDQYAFDPAWLADFHRPVMLTMGSESPPTYAGVVSRLADALPAVEVERFEGAGHIPHMTHPDEYIETTRDFIRRNAQ
jgi:pimeloyl-ACP methyl ester carboxylesterase